MPCNCKIILLGVSAILPMNYKIVVCFVCFFVLAGLRTVSDDAIHTATKPLLKTPEVLAISSVSYVDLKDVSKRRR
jgi:uncharacterized protein (DUF2225 family)